MKIIRTVLRPEQVTALASKLKEPYSTLVLFLAVTGLRIGEAIAIKWSDFEGDVLHVCRRIYEGEIDTPKTKGSERHLPIPEALLARMQALGWHDLRHSLVTQLRKCGWAAKVVSEIVGHPTPHITEAIYDHADREDFRAALGEIAGQLLRDVTKCTINGAQAKTEVTQ
jgi:integrase